MEKSWIEKVDEPYFWSNLDISEEYRDQLEENTFTTAIEFRERIWETIDAFLDSDKQTLILAFDGLPGAGKTHNSLKIKQAIDERIGIPCERIEFDMFLGTKRGSEERKRMNECFQSFEQYYQQEEKAREFFQDLVNADPGQTIEATELYNRQEGGAMNGTLQKEIPEGKKIYMVEGTNSARILSQIERPDDVDLKRYLIGVYPAVSALKAIARDIDPKKEAKKAQKENRPPNPVKDPESAIRSRMKEVSYTLMQWKENLENENYDEVFWRNRKNHQIVEQMDSYIEKLNKRGIDIDKNMMKKVVEEETDAFYEQHKKCADKCECYLLQGAMRDNIIRVLDKGTECAYEQSQFESAVNDVLGDIFYQSLKGQDESYPQVSPFEYVPKENPIVQNAPPPQSEETKDSGDQKTQ